jgi:acetyl/propionyl-CoA carboxylase alpha subunit
MHVVSQSDVVAFLARRAPALGALGAKTLSQLGLAAKPVVCVPGEMSTINALEAMAVRALAFACNLCATSVLK